MTDGGQTRAALSIGWAEILRLLPVLAIAGAAWAQIQSEQAVLRQMVTAQKEEGSFRYQQMENRMSRMQAQQNAQLARIYRQLETLNAKLDARVIGSPPPP